MGDNVAGPFGVLGPTGPTGITGAAGLQGLRGLQGPPIGPTGPPFLLSNARLNVITPSSSPIVLTYSTLGSYYNITSAMTTDGTFTIALPSYSPTYTDNTQSSIVSASGNGTRILYSTSITPHLLQVNSIVTISGISDFAGANLTNATVATVPSPTTFTILSSLVGSGTYGSFSNTIGSETVSPYYPAPETAGKSWFFRNNFYYSLTATLSNANGSVSYHGSNGVTSIYISYGQGIAITYNGSNGFIVM